MKNSTNKFQIISFYRFVRIKDKTLIKKKIGTFIKEKFVRGTILIANEGINGSISGNNEDLEIILKFIKRNLHVRNLNLKINEVNFLPFNRLKIRLKNEIVSLGKGYINSNLIGNNYVNPSNWNLLLEEKNLILIDLRNEYEIKIGKFKNAINPKTKTFREFPSKLDKLNLKKNDRIAMYCTGGIRCEKASRYLTNKGFKNILQLKGGILNYLDYTSNNNIKSKWNGECFVFDNRVTVNKKLETGKYVQCHGCRNPLTTKDLKSDKYVKGVSCHYCFSSRTEVQKVNSLNRQKQINNAEIKGESHPFKRINKL